MDLAHLKGCMFTHFVNHTAQHLGGGAGDVQIVLVRLHVDISLQDAIVHFYVEEAGLAFASLTSDLVHNHIGEELAEAS